MIVGIGNDVVDMRRLARVHGRHPQRFARRVLTEAERQQLPPPQQAAAFLAGRWAAKEALGKALGCGVRAPLTFQQVGVVSGEQGGPRFAFAAPAQDFLRQRGVEKCHLSISHDGDYACAVVVAEGGR